MVGPQGPVLSENLRTLIGALRLPVVVAPMFIVSTPKMVIESCGAGLLGSFPAHNARTREDLTNWLNLIAAAETEAKNQGDRFAPYAVNLVLHDSNPRWRGDLDLICDRRVPLVLTSKGAPRGVFERIRDYGGLVMHDVATARHTEKALEAGADGLIAVAGGSGGHCGTINPFALMGELRALTDKPIALAGGLSTGGDIRAAECLGADLAYMGTRFLMAEEANADPAYQQMIARAASSDVIFTRFHRSPANLLRESVEAEGMDPKRLMDHPAELPAALDRGIKLWSRVWSAGHGAGVLSEVAPIAEIVDVLERDYSAS